MTAHVRFTKTVKHLALSGGVTGSWLCETFFHILANQVEIDTVCV